MIVIVFREITLATSLSGLYFFDTNGGHSHRVDTGDK
jgi:hypothetical protein